MVYELFGITYDVEGDGTIRILVATFSSLTDAEEYVKETFVPFNERLYKRLPYHPASVLSGFIGHEIEEGVGIPHNPTKNW